MHAVSRDLPMAPPSSLCDDHLFLMGRPPVSELIGFIRTMATDGHAVDQGALTTEWRAANAHLVALEKNEAGVADNPPLAELPPSLKHFAEAVLADSASRRTYSNAPTSVALVELDKLVVFQKYINLGYVEQIKSSLQSPLPDEDMARLVFGLDRGSPRVVFRQAGPNVYTFISPSNDFRALEAAVLRPDQVVGLAAPGRPFAYLALAIGFGCNHLNAISIENRLVLNNGSHRAFALRALGVTHAPCIIQHVGQRDELEVVASGDLVAHPDRYLKVPRPALLKDYFDPQLTKVVAVPRKNRLVQVQVAHAASDVPAT